MEYDTVLTNGSGLWSLNALDSALDQSDSITVTSLLAGKSASITGCSYKKPVFISTCTDPISDASLITLNTKGLCGLSGSSFPGAQIRVYYNGSLVTPNGGSIYSSGTVTVASDSSWIWTCNGTSSCNSGAPCQSNGTYSITQQTPGSCESDPIFKCLNVVTTTAVPSITTSPLTTATTLIVGTSAANATVYIYQNGAIRGTSLADGTGAWSFGGLSLNNCDSLEVRAQASGSCISGYSPKEVVTGSIGTPSLTCGMKAGDTHVNGTVDGNPGDTILVFHYVDLTATVNVDTFFLTAYDNFQGDVSNVLAAGDSLRITVSPTGCYTSDDTSLFCIVADTASAPTLNCGLSYSEGDSIVSGTHATPGSKVVIYIDGDSVGQAIVDASFNWTDTLAQGAMYTGGLMYATAFVPGNAESDSSNTCTIACAPPLNNLNLLITDSVLCSGIELGHFTLQNSEAGIIYEPYDVDLGVTIGPSTLGTGSDIELTTNLLTVDPTRVTLKAYKIAAVTCETYFLDTIEFVLDPTPDTSLTISPLTISTCPAQTVDVSVLLSEVGVKYQLFDSLTGTTSGDALAGTGGTLVLTSSALNESATLGIRATDTTSVSSCQLRMNDWIKVQVVGPDLTVPVTASETQVCPSQTVDIGVQTENNSSFVYTVKRLSDTSDVGTSFLGDGTIVYRTAGVNADTNSFAVEVVYLMCTLSLNDTVSVTRNLAPIALSEIEDSVAHGQVIGFNVLSNDTDPESDSIGLTIISGPTNGSAIVSGDSLVVTTDSFYAGVDTIFYSVCDSCGNCDTAFLALDIINNPPLAAADFVTCNEDDVAVEIAPVLNDSDPDGDELSISIVSGPANGTATLIFSDSLSYTPDPNFNGTDEILYEVCDALTPSLCDTDTIFITVDPVNDAPLAANDTVQLSEDTVNAQIDVQANDSDLENNNLTTTIISGPSNGTASVPTGTYVQYSPSANYSGVDTIFYQICDDGSPSECDTAYIALDITPVNDAPVANPDYLTLDEDASGAVADVLANDTDVENDQLTTTIVSGPANGTATVLNGDSISYSPDLNYFGMDTIVYQVCDDGTPSECDVDTLFLTINSINDAPQASNDIVTLTEDTINAQIDVLTNDSDVENNNLTTTIISGPTNGTASVPTSTYIQYSPSPNYNGVDTIFYSVCDDGSPSECDTAFIALDITPVNDAPIANPDYLTLDEDASGAVADVLANDTDAENDQLTTTILSGPANGSASVLNGDSISYSPDLNYFGADTIVYQVCDDGTPSECAIDTLYLTINSINDAPQAVNDTVTFSEDTVNAQIDVLTNDSDVENNNLTTTITAGPSNGTASVPTGTYIQYSPALNFNGADTIFYQICDDGSPSECDVAFVAIEVTPVNDAPVALKDSLTIEEDSTGAHIPVQSNDVDVEGDDLTTSLLAGPFHGTSSIVNGDSISYDPDPDYFGADTIVYQICDNGSPSLCDADTVFIDVLPVNDAPITVSDTLTIAEDSLGASIDVLANDSDIEGNNLSITITNGPAYGTAGVVGSAVISYDPNSGYFGTDTVVYEVCDDGSPSLCNSDTLYIEVTPVNDPPVASTDSLSIEEDSSSAVILVQANDSDPEGDSLFTSIVTPPSFGTAAVLNNDSISYEPNSNYFGPDTIIYEICDNGIPSLCDTDTVFIQIDPVNDTPVASADYLTVNEDTSGAEIFVLANDVDIEGDSLTTSLVQSAANGATTVLGDSSIQYVPDLNFNGADTIVYQVCDNGTPSLCDTDTVFIQVDPVNDAPVASTDSLTIVEDSTGAMINVQSNDFDEEGDGLLTSIVQQPNSGTATVSNGDSISYEPNTDFFGEDTIVYSICDDGAPSLCDTDTVFITVLPVNDPPLAQNDAYTIDEDSTGVILQVLTNDQDVESDSLKVVTIISPPSSGTAYIMTGDSQGIMYDAGQDYFGVDSLTYQVCEVFAPTTCDTASVMITILPVNDAPVAQTDFFETIRDTAGVVFDVQTNDLDPENDELTSSIVTGPTSGGIATVLSGDSISYTPPEGFLGADTILYSVCDNGTPSLCDTDTVFITVELEPNAPPSAVNDSYEALDSTVIILDVQANDSDPKEDPLTTEVVLPPSNGIASVLGGDSISYVSDPGFCGVDSILYRVCDDRVPSLCDSAYAFITITPRDSDGDGIPDHFEGYNDPDGDGIPNHLDQDSDGDSIPDSLEVGGDQGDCVFMLDDADGDGVANFLDHDSDGDGRADSIEVDADMDGIWDDCDSNGVPDWLDPFFCEDLLPFIIPEGFSPNGDGVNDFFVIQGLSRFPDNALLIFNRWGKKIYQAEPYNNDWDGSDRSGTFTVGTDILPEGTYYYILKLEDEERSGYIYLNR